MLGLSPQAAPLLRSQAVQCCSFVPAESPTLSVGCSTQNTHARSAVRHFCRCPQNHTIWLSHFATGSYPRPPGLPAFANAPGDVSCSGSFNFLVVSLPPDHTCSKMLSTLAIVPPLLSLHEVLDKRFDCQTHTKLVWLVGRKHVAARDRVWRGALAVTAVAEGSCIAKKCIFTSCLYQTPVRGEKTHEANTKVESKVQTCI